MRTSSAQRQGGLGVACYSPGGGRAGVAVLTAAILVQLVAAQTSQPAADHQPSPWQAVLRGLADTGMAGVPGQAAPASESSPAPSDGWPADLRGLAEGEEVTRTDTGLLEVHARDIEIAMLLETLSYEAHANIVTSTSVTGRVSANLYAVSLEQALDAILTPNRYAFCTYGGTVFVGTPVEIAALRPPPLTRVYRLRYIRPSEAAAAVRAVLGADAQVVEGGAEGDDDSGTAGQGMAGQMQAAGVDYVIVTAHAAGLAAVEKLLAEIDLRPKQVLIEATVLRATLTEGNQFGVDFAMLGGVDFQDVGGTSLATTNLSLGQLPPNDLQSTTFNVNTDFSGNITGGGFTFGLIKDSLAGFIRALEDVTDVVVVANPKLVALNKQEAEVIVGRRDGYLTTTVTETAAIQTVEFLETGTQIKFCPMINEDGTVRLSVHPKDSNGGLTAANLPFEETTEAQADILVDDGDTVLIGGLFRERTVTSKSQIPLLGDIPVAGELFGSRNDQTVREEVIILLTVHVIKETEEEFARYRGLLEDVERIRVGSRQGLLGSGRQRLAQACYHEALRRLEAGDREQALLNVRMTLSNQPNHLAAFKLRERLLEERMWDDEGTRMRTFVLDLIRQERAEDVDQRIGAFGRPRPQTDPAQPADQAEEGPTP